MRINCLTLCCIELSCCQGPCCPEEPKIFGDEEEEEEILTPLDAPGHGVRMPREDWGIQLRWQMIALIEEGKKE